MEPLCRLCLGDGPDLSPIQNYASSGQSLVQLIRKYLSIQIIKAESTESPFICTLCQTAIEEWHRFHSACRKNDKTYQRRQSELVQKAEQEQKEENLPLSHFKQEVDETVAEDFVEVYLDSKSNQDSEVQEEHDLEDQRHRSAVPDEDGDDAGSAECTTSEDEVIVKDVEPPKRKKKSTPSNSVEPKKRGRPKKPIEEKQQRADGEPRYKKRVCTICGKFVVNLKDHIRIHNNERRHQCPHCSKTFVSASNYCAHVNIHTRAKLYKCNLCDKEYALLNSLKQHQNTHSKERIYQCQVCGKAYYQPTELTRHKRTHFEEPKIKCSECDKMFMTNADLRKHFRRHVPDKEFSCEICNRGFRRRNNLKSHMRVHLGGSKAAKSDSVDAPSDDRSIIKVKSLSGARTIDKSAFLPIF